MVQQQQYALLVNQSVTMKTKQNFQKKHTHKTNEELHQEIRDLEGENETLKSLIRDILKMLGEKI